MTPAAPAHGFRFTTLALAASPFVPVIPWQDPSGAWQLLSFVQNVALHLADGATAHAGGVLLLGPALLGGVSLLVPTSASRARRSLSLCALALAALGPVLVHLQPGLAPWFSLDALIPAARYIRWAWMTFLLAALWAYMEMRHQMEDA